MEKRPWGYFETIKTGEGFLVKKIWIHPNQRISLQRHWHRSENWVIVQGSGKLTCGNTVTPAAPGTTLFVPENAVHRAEAGPEGLGIIEVQRGATSLRPTSNVLMTTTTVSLNGSTLSKHHGSTR